MGCIGRWGARALGAVVLLCISLPSAAKDNRSSAQAIKQQIIEQSISSYPGNCPCPYSTMRNGRSCGKRSAYSRPGGYAPKCYPEDVSEGEVQAYRENRQ